eukprot:gnl/MRDRNA2_/MRDRNA2_204888_c0_seq1.p1 gnl/MRDRNA2_/MRDRNA2_204888_c0~~gnl/MRDRNA2_/MRDRNA2_204888_c0_seq1.p1  ORF type:complete len:313 (+),score=52.94 gnl/MRDRNA2_/MRDRNA2_204888_c0_seq1:99-941(+)
MLATSQYHALFFGLGVLVGTAPGSKIRVPVHEHAGIDIGRQRKLNTAPDRKTSMLIDPEGVVGPGIQRESTNTTSHETDAVFQYAHSHTQQGQLNTDHGAEVLNEVLVKLKTTTQRKFGFCGKCSDGKYFRMYKNSYMGRQTAYKRMYITTLDANKVQAHEIRWDMKDNQDIVSEYYTKCDELRDMDHDHDNPQKGENTDKVIKAIKACFKAPEICASNVAQVHYVTDKKHDQCVQEYNQMDGEIGEKVAEEQRRSSASALVLPVWVLMVISLRLRGVAQ